MPRERVKAAVPNYFVGQKSHLQFISTGCTLLDCAIGGGLTIGRVANLVGDRSTAKTGLAVEAMINFLQQFPNGACRYCEAEAAFDAQYAEAMGLKLDRVDFGEADEPITTVEQFIEDFDKFLDARIKDKESGIYVLDSLDALSDEAEMDRKTGTATYGMQKPKLLSEFFRKTARKIENSKVLLLIVSQVRDNIGAGLFGEKYKRSGGKALDFYASQVVWLAKIKNLKRTIAKVERTYGVEIKASVKKNKVGLPFREAEFSFIFGYGVEDLGASVAWLDEIGRLDDAGLDKSYLKEIGKLTDADYRKDNAEISKVVKKVWAEVETSFLPVRKKYT